LPNGQLIAKGTSEYEEARCRNFAQNAHHPSVRKEETVKYQPAFIAVCQSVEDVQASVKFARDQCLQVTVRSGGHNWFGSFLRENVLLVDMKHFDSMSIEGTVATVGPAVVGTDLNQAAAEHGFCFSSGHCSGVPLGGFLLGGGLGWFLPYYGLAAEHIEQVKLVDPQGSLVTVKDDDDDWMWMARGSASAFPGVVVEYKIRLSPLPAIVRCKMDFFPIESYASVVSFLNDFVTGNPEDESKKKLELTVNLVTTPQPLAEVAKVPKLIMVIQTWMADSEDAFKQQVAGLALDKFPVPSLVPGEFRDFSFAGLSGLLVPAFPPGHHWICRALLYESRSFSALNWKDIQETFAEKAPLGLSHCMLVFSPERLASKPGCYGQFSAKGFGILVLGVHGPDDEATPAQDYVRAMMELVDSKVWKYDPLEHPLNKETFAKSFPDGDALKVTEMRSKLDPDQVFFDPTKVDARY